MTVDYVSASSSSGLTDTATVQAPAGIVAGNLLLALVFDASGTTSADWIGPADWTLQGSQKHRAYGDGVAVWTKVAGTAEPASYDFGSNGNTSIVLLQYEGTAGLDGAPQFANSGKATNTSAPVTTTTAGGKLVLAYGSVHGYTWSAPDGTTARDNARTVSVSSIYAFDVPLDAAGLSPSYTSTASGSDGSVSAAVALLAADPGDDTPAYDAAQFLPFF